MQYTVVARYLREYAVQKLPFRHTKETRKQAIAFDEGSANGGTAVY
jgi:hypothetical protein